MRVNRKGKTLKKKIGNILTDATILREIKFCTLGFVFIMLIIFLISGNIFMRSTSALP